MKFSKIVVIVSLILIILSLHGCASSSRDLMEISFDMGCEMKSFTERGSMKKIECK